MNEREREDVSDQEEETSPGDKLEGATAAWPPISNPISTQKFERAGLVLPEKGCMNLCPMGTAEGF